jgi:hypothetical protein
MADDLVASLNTYMLAATNALVAHDYGTAIDNALAAQGILAILPDAERSSGRVAGSRHVKWTPDGINQFIIRIRQQQASSLGVQRINRTYQQTDVQNTGEDW